MNNTYTAVQSHDGGQHNDEGETDPCRGDHR